MDCDFPPPTKKKCVSPAHKKIPRPIILKQNFSVWTKQAINRMCGGGKTIVDLQLN